MVKKLFISLGSLLLLTLIVAAGLPVLASTNAQTIEPPPVRPIYDPSGLYQSIDPSLTARANSEPALPPPLGLLTAQSGVVFNRLDGQNLNIYLYDTFSGATYTLTYGGYDKIRPRINPEYNRIVFYSNLNTPGYQIYTMNMDGSNLMRVGNFEGQGINPAWSPDGTHIVFASNLNNPDGDIFTMDTSGNGITRLTNNAVYDDMPSWSPDGSKIAYISYANNVYRVWVMNSDGTGAVQLSQEAYSDSPVWSPDGSQIAYGADGDGDGWLELWVMDADGTNRHQIYKPPTANTDAYMGSWNPGGTSLTFTRVQWIYIDGNWYWTEANLACTTVLPGGACFNDFGDVHWYPDWGSSDHSAPIIEMSELPVVVPYQFTVFWSGYDPGGSGIRYYNVQVKAGPGGVWTDWLQFTTDTQAVYTGGEAGVTYYFRTRAYDNVGNLSHWPDTYQAYAQVESLVPVTSVAQLPRYARNSVTVKWSGFDPGWSGIRDYDLQYKDITVDDVWVNWLTSTTETSHELTGIAGHTYYFRSRGTDNAGNVESWPAGDGDAQVTFYDWLLNGSASDILGAPLMGVEASIASGEAGRLPSDFNGIYTSYGTSAPTEQVSWEKPGYSALPGTTFDGSVDRGFDIFLPPNPNAIQNPGFELDLNMWQTTGNVTADTLPHTGVASARLGTPFSFGESVTFEDYSSWTAIGGIQTDAAGGVHIMWRKENLDNYTFNIYYDYRSPAGTWSPVETVASSITTAYYPPRMVVTTDGTAHVFYSSIGILYNTHRISSNNWSSPEGISGDYYADDDLIATGDDVGNIHVAWICNVAGGGQMCYSRKPAGSAWEQIVQLTNYPPTMVYPFQIIAQNEEVHLLWAFQNPVDYSMHVDYARRDGDSTWLAPEDVCPTCEKEEGVRMAVDSTGLPQVAWYDQWSDNEGWHSALYFSQRINTGSWLPPHILDGNASAPQIVIDYLGRTHVAWSGKDIMGLFHAYRGLDGSWHKTNPITDHWMPFFDLMLDEQGAVDLVFPDGFTHWMGGPQWMPTTNFGSPESAVEMQAVTDIFGGVHILWSESLVSSSNLVYVSPHIVNTPGVSTLSQSFQVGDASSNPVLSFLSATGGANSTDEATFSVTLSTGISSTLIYTSTGWNEGWQHHIMDMSAWAGQAVTLTTSLAQPANYPDAWAYVDEVVLGSVYPDPWVKLDGGALLALPGDQFNYQINYGNHGMIDSPGTIITMTLPAGLSIVDSSIQPVIVGSQLIWDLGTLPPDSLPATISIVVVVDADAPVGSTISTLVDVSTSSVELETLNNSAQLETLLAARFYIPILKR